MKKLLLIYSIVALGFHACNKDDVATAGFDFSNTLPPYVELNSTDAKTVKQGASTTVTFQMRTAFQEAVTVNYDVTGGGVNLTNQSVVIDRNKTSAVATRIHAMSAELYFPKSLKVAKEGTNKATIATIIKMIKGAELLKLIFFI